MLFGHPPRTRLQQPNPGSAGAVLRDVPIAYVPTPISATCAESPSGGVCSRWFVTLRRAVRSHSPRYWFGSFPHEGASCRRETGVSISVVWVAAVACPVGCPVVNPVVRCATAILCVSSASCVRCVSCASGDDCAWLADCVSCASCVRSASCVGCVDCGSCASCCRCANIVLCVSSAKLVICADGHSVNCTRDLPRVSIPSTETTAVSSFAVVLICN